MSVVKICDITCKECQIRGNNHIYEYYAYAARQNVLIGCMEMREI